MNPAKLRIAVLSLYPRDSTRIAGGVRAVAYNLVQGLGAYDDLELHVIHCHSDVPEDFVMADGAATIHFLGVSQQRVIPNMVTAIPRIRQALRTLQPDLVHAHIAPYAVAAQGMRCPSLYTIHGLAGLEAKAYTATLFDKLRYRLYAHYDTRALRRATDLVAISDYVMDAYEKSTSARWYRINNPIPEAFFLADAAKQIGKPIILFAGSITEVKDLGTLIRALRLVRERIPDARLELAGRVTSESYHAQLLDSIREHGLAASVSFLGLLDRVALVNAYAECAVLALPSRQENAPMAIIEAMAVGKPVVATRVGGVAELVADGETGFLVPPGNARAMADCLTKILASSDLRDAMGQSAQARARGRHGVRQVAAQYRQVYRRILGLPSDAVPVERASP